VDAPLRQDVLVELDAAEAHQVLDQPRHPLGLVLHDPQEPIAGDRVVAGMPAQRLDEAGERGERGAQLMAGVGEQVGAPPRAAAGAGGAGGAAAGGGAAPGPGGWAPTRARGGPRHTRSWTPPAA